MYTLDNLVSNSGENTQVQSKHLTLVLQFSINVPARSSVMSIRCQRCNQKP
jgi:hypothetical protein